MIKVIVDKVAPARDDAAGMTPTHYTRLNDPQEFKYSRESNQDDGHSDGASYG